MRIAKPTRRIPPYLPFMIAVTGFYLTVEIPFSVHLVDVLGGTPTEGDISSIERFGRILTGAAVAIAVVGSLLARADARYQAWRWPSPAPRRGFLSVLPRTLLIGMVSAGATYFALDRIAEAIGDLSSAESRKASFVSMMARNVVAASPELVAAGLDRDDPAWRAFISVSPVLDAAGFLTSLAGDPAAIRANDAVLRLGSPSEVRNGLFGNGFGQMRDAYDSYREGSERYLRARREADRKVRGIWSTYLHRRREAGYTGRSSFQVRRVRKEVRDWGIPVPANWHPDDRRGLESAYRSRLMGEIERRYASAIEERLGYGVTLPPGLEWRNFVAHPTIQRIIRRDAGLPAGGTTIRPEMGDIEFQAAVYQPLRTSLIGKLTEIAAAPPSDFVGDARYAEIGRSAAMMAAIPTLAIILSLAGAMLHICKIVGFGTQVVGHVSRMPFLAGAKGKWTVGATAAAAFAAVGILPGNAVTASPTYGVLYADGGVMAPIITGSIAMQPTLRPIGHILGDMGAWRIVSIGLPVHRPPPRPAIVVASTRGNIPGQVALPLPRPADDIAMTLPLRKPGEVPDGDL